MTELRRRRELAQRLALTKTPDHTLAAEHLLADAELAAVDGDEREQAQARHMTRRSHERHEHQRQEGSPWKTAAPSTTNNLDGTSTRELVAATI